MTTPHALGDVFALFNEVAIIEQLGRAHLERALAPHGLKAPHFAVLNHLTRLGDGRNPARIAAAFEQSKANMTNTLQRLEAKGLIELRPDPEDGRAKRVYLTAAGREAHTDAIIALAPWLTRIEDSFGLDRIRATLPFLSQLRAWLDKARD